MVLAVYCYSNRQRKVPCVWPLTSFVSWIPLESSWCLQLALTSWGLLRCHRRFLHCSCGLWLVRSNSPRRGPTSRLSQFLHSVLGQEERRATRYFSHFYTSGTVRRLSHSPWFLWYDCAETHAILRVVLKQYTQSCSHGGSSGSTSTSWPLWDVCHRSHPPAAGPPTRLHSLLSMACSRTSLVPCLVPECLQLQPHNSVSSLPLRRWSPQSRPSNSSGFSADSRRSGSTCSIGFCSRLSSRAAQTAGRRRRQRWFAPDTTHKPAREFLSLVTCRLPWALKGWAAFLWPAHFEFRLAVRPGKWWAPVCLQPWLSSSRSATASSSRQLPSFSWLVHLR